jgi:2-dehydropantoate 2-reductase
MNDNPNNQKPRILVAGMGAVGTTLAARLRHAGHTVSAFARGETLNAIGRTGLRVLDSGGESQTSVTIAPIEQLGHQDIVLLCSKAQDLPDLAEAVAVSIGPNTLVLPIVNGIPWWYFEGLTDAGIDPWIRSVDPANRLHLIVPSTQIVGCVALFTAERLAPGYVLNANPPRLVIGAINAMPEGRLAELGALLNGSGIETRVTSSIRNSIWTKVVLNLMSNPLSVVAETHLRDLCSDRYLADVTAGLRNEALRVAESYGAEIEMDPSSLLAFGASMGEAKTSMLQDYRSGRPLELQAICEAVMELAGRKGIEMPLTRMVTMLARYKSGRVLKAA